MKINHNDEKKKNIWMKKMKCFNKVQRKPKAKILKNWSTLKLKIITSTNTEFIINLKSTRIKKTCIKY